MELKTKELLELIKENEYPKDLNNYLTEMLEQNKLTYENLKYLYNKLYKDKPLYIRQNLFTVSQFLIKGYSIEEAEEIANLLPDANGLNVFCQDKKEKDDLFNKPCLDLEFAYMQYDYYKNIKDTKNRAYEIIKEDIELTTVQQREIEVQIKNLGINTSQKLKESYETIDKEIKKLKTEFDKNTSNDEKLAEYFKDDDPKDRYKDIILASTILTGIQLRNIWRDNGNLDGEKEEYPYNEEQRDMIHKYNRLEETLEKLEYYAEYIFCDEEEME